MRLFLSIIALITCSSLQAQTTIHITDASMKLPIVYTTGIEPAVFFPGFIDSNYLNADGSAELQFHLSQPQFINVGAQGAGKLLVIEPGEIYQLNFSEVEGKYVCATSEPSVLQNLSDSFNRSVHYMGIDTRLPLAYPIEKIKDSLWVLLQDDIEKLEVSLNEGAISKHGYQLLKLERETYYPRILHAEYLHKLTWIKGEERQKFIDQTQSIRQELLSFDPTDESLMRSPHWFWLTDHYLTLKVYVENNYDYPPSNNMGYFDIKSYRAQQHLKGKAHEYYWAANLRWWYGQKDFSINLFSETEAFHKQYPKSKLWKYIVPVQHTITAFNDAASKEFSPQTRLVKKADKIKTLNALKKKLRGNKYYVNVWATWCGPCKNEFAHAQKLEAALKEKGYRVLYVSIDEKMKSTLWQNMIKYYKLSGEHMMANEYLKKQLEQLHGDNYAIPWFFIVDEKGNVRVKHASPPSEMEMLMSEL